MCNFCWLLGGGGKSKKLCKSKKGGREGSIESQQKFDFFSYDDMPNHPSAIAEWLSKPNQTCFHLWAGASLSAWSWPGVWQAKSQAWQDVSRTFQPHQVPQQHWSVAHWQIWNRNLNWNVTRVSLVPFPLCDTWRLMTHVYSESYSQETLVSEY